MTRIICLGRPRHHRQFGDPGQQTPTTSAHPGDTGTTLRPAHVPSSFRSHRTHSDPAESMGSSLNNTHNYLFQPQEIPQRSPGSFATGIIDAHSEVGEPGQQTPKASAHPGDMRTLLRITAEPATPHPDYCLPSVPSSRRSSRKWHPEHLGRSRHHRRARRSR